MKLISLKIGVKMLNDLREKAEENGLSVSAYIRQLIAKDLREDK